MQQNGGCVESLAVWHTSWRTNTFVYTFWQQIKYQKGTIWKTRPNNAFLSSYLICLVQATTVDDNMCTVCTYRVQQRLVFTSHPWHFISYKFIYFLLTTSNFFRLCHNKVRYCSECLDITKERTTRRLHRFTSENKVYQWLDARSNSPLMNISPLWSTVSYICLKKVSSCKVSVNLQYLTV